MGIYHELKADIILKPVEEIGEDIHMLLMCLFNQVEGVDIEHAPKDALPNHPFWKQERFYSVGLGGYSKDHEDGEPASYEHPVMKLRTYMNHGHDTISAFLDWLAPYVDSVTEPGVYYIDGSYEYNVHHYDVKFETNPEGKKSFLLVAHWERPGNSCENSNMDEVNEWITLPVAKTTAVPDYRPQAFYLPAEEPEEFPIEFPHEGNITFKAHRPSFIDSDTPLAECEIETLEELFNLPTVKQFSEINGHCGFALDGPDKGLEWRNKEPVYTLMHIAKEGKEWWVVGFLGRGAASLGLPEWEQSKPGMMPPT